MGLDEIINQILSSRSDIKREEIRQMIKTKKQGAANFLTDETAARIIASDMGIKISKKAPRLKIQIKDLISGLNDVSILGQVMSIYPPKTFKRRNWTEGKIASILVSDKTGSLRVVLWDNKADIIEKGKIQQQQTIKISHAYVREGQDGTPELHLGEKGSIKIISDTTRKLAEITQTGGPFTVQGTISTAPDFREVTTSKNEPVKVASFDLSDETGKIKVTAWRNNAQAVKHLTAGTKIKMKNIYAKKGHKGGIELSSSYSTLIEVMTEE
jgi:replication factor A1